MPTSARITAAVATAAAALLSKGGGQLVGCRQVARFAQLILNKGLWPSSAAPHAPARTGGLVEERRNTNANEKPEVIVGSKYVEELMSPQFPARGFSYGLLTWLNAKRDPAVSPACTYG